MNVIPDQPLWSVRRIARALHEWAWLIGWPDTPCYVPLRRMLRFHGRPYAEYLYDTRRPTHA